MSPGNRQIKHGCLQSDNQIIYPVNIQQNNEVASGNEIYSIASSITY